MVIFDSKCTTSTIYFEKDSLQSIGHQPVTTLMYAHVDSSLTLTLSELSSGFFSRGLLLLRFRVSLPFGILGSWLECFVVITISSRLCVFRVILGGFAVLICFSLGFC